MNHFYAVAGGMSSAVYLFCIRSANTLSSKL